MKAITRARARHRRRLRICDDAHQSHVFLKEVVSTRFSLRRNKESVVVVVVVVLLKKKKDIFLLSFSLHRISSSHINMIKLVPLLLFFFSTCKKKIQHAVRRFFEFALFLKSH
jgi:hypothetical protein